MINKTRFPCKLLLGFTLSICCLYSLMWADRGLAAEYRLDSVPNWVTMVRFQEPEKIPENDILQGYYTLLVDTQEKPKFGNQQSYKHFVQKVVNKQGVEYLSQVSINFDPSYQTLLLHAIKVHRNKRIYSRLHPDSINLLQREEGLEYQMLDGRKTLNVILDDIRIGDIVEYAYTLEGENPVYDRTYFNELGVGWRTPVHRIFHRLLWPASQRLAVKSHQTSLRPRITMSNGVKEYVLIADNIPAIIPDSDLPSWYSPYPWIQFSESSSWGEVAEWAVKLFAGPPTISNELQEKIEAIAAESAEPAQRFLSALRFVQDDIRYMGIETGLSSHVPHDPSLVLRRRFGDCKDKTFLLKTILTSLGITSHPVLVNTYADKSLLEWLPAENAFNHVILKAELGGKSYWVDPTRAYQRGTLQYHDQVDFPVVLVVAEETTGLTMIAPPEVKVPKNESHEYFVIGSDFADPSQLHVETVYRYGYADSIRARLANTSKGELEKQFLNYYARAYPEITVAKPLEIKDDEKLNVLIIKEYYTIANHWRPSSEDADMMNVDFYPLSIYDLIEQPETRQRTMPLGISHPVHYRLTTTVYLPSEWEAELVHDKFEDEAVRFDYDVEYEDKILTMSYDYQSKIDHLEPDKAAKHISYSEKMEDNLGYVLYTKKEATEVVPQNPKNGSPPGGEIVAAGDTPPQSLDMRWYDELNWSALLVAFFSFGAAGYAAFKLYRHEPGGETEIPPTGATPDGIRGWLLLLALALVIQPILLLTTFSYDAYGNSTFLMLTTPGSEYYHAMWQPVLLFELVVNIAIFVFSILFAILFFQKRNIFPKSYMVFLAVGMVIRFSDYIAMQVFDLVEEEFLRLQFAGLKSFAIGAIVWSLYLKKSKRVKNTFVKPSYS